MIKERKKMLSKKTKKAIALSMALTMVGGFAQSSTILTAAYGEEINGQEASDTLEDSFTKANKSLTEKLDSELNDKSTQEDIQTILSGFEYVTSGAAVNVTSSAAVKITASNITAYKNDDEGCSFKASLEGYEKNGESYELKDTKEFTYSKPKETSTLTTMAYSSPVVSGEWETSNPLTSVGQEVTITKENQIVKFKLLNEENKTVSVSGNGMKDEASIADGSVELDIPKTITCNGTVYTVTEIGDSAFYKCQKLAKVTIPDSVKSIKYYAFRLCTKITSITLPKDLKSIGESAFVACRMKSIILPESLETIGKYAFSNCVGIEVITFPESSNTTIGERAFMSCTGIKSIIIPEGVTSIGSEAFYACSNLKYIKLPDGLDSSSKWGIPTIPTMVLISKDCNPDIKDYMDKGPYDDGFDGKLEYQYKILGLNLGNGSNEISSYKGSISYADVLQKDDSTTSASVKVEIISGNDDNIAEVTFADNKVSISATGKGNGIVKVKVTAEETVNGETYNFYKIREFEISNNTDKTLLISLYNKYEAMIQGEYTDDSFNNFTVAVNNAKSVIDNGNATQSAIVASEKKLQDAVSALKLKSSTPNENGSSGGSSSSNSSGGSSSSSSNSSSSSSNSNQNTSKTEEININVTDGSSSNLISQTKIERTTASDGRKKDTVSYTESKAQETIEQLAKEGKDTARIVIPDPKNEVSETRVNIPSETLSTLSSGSVNLEISTENARISLPKQTVQDLSQNRNEDLYFNLVPIKDAAKNQEIQANANREAIMQVVSGSNSVQALGNPIAIETNMSQRQVDVTLPLRDINIPTDSTERQVFLNDLGIYIEHSDGTKEFVKGEIVEYESGVYGIKFTVTKFSNFTIVKLNQQGTGSWQNSERGWKYIVNGQPAIGWKQINGVWYLMDSTGIMETGWRQDNGVWYLLRDNGSMATGWAQSNGLWYFLEDSGAMTTGWKQVSGKWYYLYSNGSMASNTVIDGYTLGKDGVWIN
jgi:uncharacterized protein YpiB (UPF0302 family)